RVLHDQAGGVQLVAGAGLLLQQGDLQARQRRGARARQPGKAGADHQQVLRHAPRWRTASYRQIPLATETFRLSTPPSIGMDTSASQVLRVSWRMPVPSAPSTSASGTFRSAW